jgi:hypothetical protein
MQHMILKARIHCLAQITVVLGKCRFELHLFAVAFGFGRQFMGSDPPNVLAFIFTGCELTHTVYPQRDSPVTQE